MARLEWFLVFSTILGLVFISGDALSAPKEEGGNVRVAARDTGRVVWTTEDYYDFGNGIVKVGEDIEVAENDTVDGDVVVVGGDISCKGVVTGDAVAIGGDVVVEGNGVIEGDATAIGGKVVKLGNGRVEGEIVTMAPRLSRLLWKPMRGVTGIAGKPKFGKTWLRSWIGINTKSGRMVLKLLSLVTTILIGLIVIAIARKGVENVSLTARRDAFKAGLIGLVTLLIAIVLGILFAITIVGIPISILLGIAVWVGMVMGETALCVAIGERWTQKDRSIYQRLAVGAMLVYSMYVIGGAIGVGDGVLEITGYIVSAVGFLIIFVVNLIGLGGVVLSRFGTRAPNSKNVNSVEAKV